MPSGEENSSTPADNSSTPANNSSTPDAFNTTPEPLSPQDMINNLFKRCKHDVQYINSLEDVYVYRDLHLLPPSFNCNVTIFVPQPETDRRYWIACQAVWEPGDPQGAMQTCTSISFSAKTMISYQVHGDLMGKTK